MVSLHERCNDPYYIAIIMNKGKQALLFVTESGRHDPLHLLNLGSALAIVHLLNHWSALGTAKHTV